MDRRLEECRFEIACDVTNPLCGERGASAVFAPQKGADARMVERLGDALSHLADVTEEVLKTDNRNLPGAGAAGGLGFAFSSYLGGDLRPGVEIVLDAVLPEALNRRASGKCRMICSLSMEHFQFCRE